MKVSVKNPSDVLSGGVLLLVGAITLYLGRDLSFGSLARMGAGFVPRVIAVLIVILSILIILRGIRIAGEKGAQVRIIPLLAVAFAPILFAVLIRPTGLFVTALAVFTLVRVACVRDFGIEALVAPLILSAAVCAIFIGLLGQPLPLFWF